MPNIIITEKELNEMDASRVLSLYQAIFDNVPNTVHLSDEEIKKLVLDALLERRMIKENLNGKII